MPEQEGRVIDRKRTYRVYREEGLRMHNKRSKKITHSRVPMPGPTKANERWSADSTSDQLPNGRRFRIPDLIEDFSCQCVGQIVDTLDSGARLARYLDEPDTTRPLPWTLVLDSSPEFISKAMFYWPRRTGVRRHFIQPGNPIWNAFVESSNGKFRRTVWTYIGSAAWLRHAPSSSSCERTTTMSGHTDTWAECPLGCSPRK